MPFSMLNSPMNIEHHVQWSNSLSHNGFLASSYFCILPAIMKKEGVIEYVRESFKKIHKLLGHILNDFNEGSIHEFRKEIKRLRAFLRLLSVEKEEENKLRITKKLKTFYGYVGIIRNLQLQQKNISEHIKISSGKLPEAYFKSLIKEMENWEAITRKYMDTEKDFCDDEKKI